MFKKISRDEFNKDLKNYIEFSRSRLEDALIGLSNEHDKAYVQIISPDGINDRLQLYLNNISLYETDKLVKDESDFVYLKDNDLLSKMTKAEYDEINEDPEEIYDEAKQKPDDFRDVT